MTPFEQFFAGEFQRRLDTVRGEPGLLSSGQIEDASWDRKAAFLLWQAEETRRTREPRAIPAPEAGMVALIRDIEDRYRDPLDDLLG